MEKTRQELNNAIANQMLVEINSLSQWLSLYDASQTSDVDNILISELDSLQKQCDFVIDKIKYYNLIKTQER